MAQMLLDGLDSRGTSAILALCSALALLMAGGFAWILRDLSLTGFFLAVSIGAAAFAALFWPDNRSRPEAPASRRSARDFDL
jgi:hypothetical protein